MKVKRSEMRRFIERWNGPEATAQIMDAIDKAYAYGYECDEPDKPMAPTLEAVINRLGEWSLRTAQWGCGGRDLNEAEARAAAEAYNRREAIEEVARTLRSYDSRRREDRAAIVPPGALAYLARLLEGNPHGADTQDGEGRS